MVSPARKAPTVRTLPGAACTSSEEQQYGEDPDEVLCQPPSGCSDRQRRLGTWLLDRGRVPATLIAIFYLLKLETWAGILVRCLYTVTADSLSRHPDLGSWVAADPLLLCRYGS